MRLQPRCQLLHDTKVNQRQADDRDHAKLCSLARYRGERCPGCGCVPILAIAAATFATPLPRKMFDQQPAAHPAKCDTFYPQRSLVPKTNAGPAQKWRETEESAGAESGKGWLPLVETAPLTSPERILFELE